MEMVWNITKKGFQTQTFEKEKKRRSFLPLSNELERNS